MFRFLSWFVFVLMLHAGCDSSAPPSIPSPAFEEASFEGAGADDFWALKTSGAIHQVAHWNGSEWRAIHPKPIAHIFRAAAAGPGKIWLLGSDQDDEGVVSAPRLVRFSADGTLEDFSSALGEREYYISQIFHGKGVTVLVKGGNTAATGQVPFAVYRFDGSAFVPMPPLPPEITVPGPGLFYGENDFYLDGWKGKEHTLVHWNGTAWDVFPVGNPVPGFTPISGPPNAPVDERWLRCGEDPVRFDGRQMVRLEASVKARCFFGYYGGRHQVIYEEVRGSADPGKAQVCDVYDNCSDVDTYVMTSTVWRMANWDGSAWVDDREVATVDGCVGNACGYGFARRFGVFSWLEDGTSVFVGSKDNVENLWLVGK